MKRILLVLVVVGTAVVSGAYTTEGNHLYIDTEGVPVFLFGGTAWNRVEKGKASSVYTWSTAGRTSTQLVKQDLDVSLITASKSGTIAFRRFENSPGKCFIDIVDAAGNLLKRLPFTQMVQAIEWSPDGDNLAFILGDPTGGEVDGSYYNAKTCIYSLKGDQTRQIFAGGYRLAWTEFDCNIYLYDAIKKPPVQRFDPKTNEMHPTNYKDVLFSKDGTYYYQRWMWIETGFDVYMRATNQKVNDLPNCVIDPLALERLEAVRWLDDERMLCIIQRGSYSESPTYVLNVRTGEIRQGRNCVLDAQMNGSAVVYKPNGELDTEQISEMPIIKAADLPH